MRSDCTGNTVDLGSFMWAHCLVRSRAISPPSMIQAAPPSQSSAGSAGSVDQVRPAHRISTLGCLQHPPVHMSRQVLCHIYLACILTEAWLKLAMHISL